MEPIDSFINKTKFIIKDPLAAVYQAEEHNYLKLLEEIEDKKENYCYEIKSKQAKFLETNMLDKTITKIGNLLIMGFGVTGAEILVHNIKDKVEDDAFDSIKPGKKVMAIYGYCNLRNYIETIEVLEEDMLILLNEVAKIVEGIAIDHLGHVCKNHGDNYLLVWKFDESLVFEDEYGELRLKEGENAVNQYLNLALIAFIRIQKQIQVSNKLNQVK